MTPYSKLSPLNGKEVGHPTSILSDCHRTLIDSELFLGVFKFLAFPMCHNGGKVLESVKEVSCNMKNLQQ